MKKSVWKKVLPLVIVFFIIYAGTIIISSIMAGGGETVINDCYTTDDKTTNTSTATLSPNASIDEFVKTYQQAYIDSWGVGGFLPSASIAQTVIETSFSMTVPSFGVAHNMGGVKGGGASNFPKTIELYGSDAVGSGTAGTSVGDNTGGSYTYFATFDAGIVGKAEFMSRQTLYRGAINNTDGIATLDAIADGGWATDPSYKTKLEEVYRSIGSQYKWLDNLAIEKYGTTPVDTGTGLSKAKVSGDEDGEDGATPCDDTPDEATDGTGKVPADATAWGYRPSELINSLKPFVHNPEDAGLTYNAPSNWVEHTGQCVALTESLGNLIWGHFGIVIGDGYAQAGAWSIIFGNKVKTTPKAGAIFSTNAANNHTGIVSHVFEDGSVLIIEQNTPLSGAMAGLIDTWNYRIVSPETQKSQGWTFAYPDNKEPKWQRVR